MSQRLAAHAAMALLVAVMAACATSPAATSGGAAPATDATPAIADPSADNTIRVEVNNNRSDAGTITVYIEPAAGVRTTLGTLGTGERKMFTYRVEAASRTVRLSAINASGQALASEQITVPRGAGLAWDLQINSVRIRR
jgi:hypothetical protein